ncbi:hypothetical protein [Pararhizobium sp. LjRoot238]|uniref:hypothetical protein n=1 Tax=Pararhizobium sp. LjRoot238 TaxID=3342293 RepID=UPI003ECCCDCE
MSASGRQQTACLFARIAEIISAFGQKGRQSLCTTPEAIAADVLDLHLQSHLIDPTLLRADRFEDFLQERQRALLALIEKAMGKKVYTGNVEEEGESAEVEGDEAEAELSIAAE